MRDEEGVDRWSYREWCAAMRKAGWKNRDQGYWRHEATGAKFYAWDWSTTRVIKYGRGEAWYPFALNRETPTEAPF